MDKRTAEKAIEILRSGAEIKCPRLIDQFVWANTVEPKFKLGEPVLVNNSLTSHGQMVDRDHIDAMNIPANIKEKAKMQARVRLSVRASNVVGRVVKIERNLKEQTFFYEIEYEINYESEATNGKPNTKHKAYAYERDLRAAVAYEENKWSQMGQVYIG